MSNLCFTEEEIATYNLVVPTDDEVEEMLKKYVKGKNEIYCGSLATSQTSGNDFCDCVSTASAHGQEGCPCGIV